MDTQQREDARIVHRVTLLMKLGNAFPQVAIQATTYKVYAENMLNVEAADIESAIAQCISELDRFPSLAQILKRVKKRPNDDKGWGKHAPHIRPDIEAHLTASERRFLSELNNVWWKIKRGEATLEECERFGLDQFGEPLYHWLPAPQRMWSSAQSAHNYCAAIRAKTGEIKPAMEVM